MTLKNILIPGVIGAGAIIAANALAPQYATAAAIGTGALILYGITRSDAVKEPHAVGIEYDTDSKGVLVKIKNPSKKPLALTSQVRLKTIIQSTDDNMMRASHDRDTTTLIGEITDPYIIGPSETITLRHDLMIPREMIESSGGNIEIKLQTHDFKSIAKLHNLNNIKAENVTEVLADIETTTVKKIDEKLDTMMEKSSTIETPIPLETQLDDAITIVYPQQYLQIIDAPEDPIISSKISSSLELDEINSIAELNLEYDIKPVKHSPIKLEPVVNFPSYIKFDVGTGKSIGYSNSMLKIMNGIERIKRSQSDKDSI